jgi:hypothetical protein
MRVRVWVPITLLLVIPLPLIAQTCSPTAYTNKLICTLPQLFGPAGLTLANPKWAARYTVASQQLNLASLTSEIGLALSTLPLGSSGTGISISFDSEHHPLANEDSLGPILTERADVIGKRNVVLGVAYQYFSFDKIDGLNLKNFPVVLDSVGWSPDLPPFSFRNDYIFTDTQVNVALNQTVFYVIFGASNRLDVSAEVPFDSVHFEVRSNALIVRTQPCESQQGPNGGGSCFGPLLDPTNSGICGEFAFFTGDYTNCQLVFSSVNAVFPYPGNAGLIILPDGTFTPSPLRSAPPPTDATGIGDIVLRGKYEAIRRERLSGAVGIGIRLPTGDVNNLLGSGTVGVAPFGILTYRGRLSPHVRLGYLWNGNSALAGDPTAVSGGSPGISGRPASATLPPEFLYSGGADYRVNKRLTVVADLIGERVISGFRVSLGSQQHYPGNDFGTDPSTTPQIPIPTIVQSIASYNSDAIAVGGKVRLFRELILAANITSRIDSGGLHSKPVPLVGLSYAFY